MTPRRLCFARLFALSAALLIAGCSADGPVAAAPAATQPAQAAAMTVDPSIPALTIVAHRMNETEKKAYDRESQTTVATIQP